MAYINVILEENVGKFIYDRCNSSAHYCQISENINYLKTINKETGVIINEFYYGQYWSYIPGESPWQLSDTDPYGHHSSTAGLAKSKYHKIELKIKQMSNRRKEMGYVW